MKDADTPPGLPPFGPASGGPGWTAMRLALAPCRIALGVLLGLLEAVAGRGDVAAEGLPVRADTDPEVRRRLDALRAVD